MPKACFEQRGHTKILRNALCAKKRKLIKKLVYSLSPAAILAGLLKDK
jgi:hypothetical protein